MSTGTAVPAFKRLSGDSIRHLSQQTSLQFDTMAAHESAQTPAPALGPAALTHQFFSELEGTWVGNKGWNVIAVPSPKSVPTDEGDFQLLVAPYIETLTFTNAGAPAPNRGGSLDQFVSALEYHQRVSNRDTSELMHVETGMFMNLSVIVDNNKEAQPLPEFNIARSGTIPHGNSIMLLGKPPEMHQGAPTIPDISSVPAKTGDNTPDGYTDPYFHGQPINAANPNEVLRNDLNDQIKDGHEVLNTTHVNVDFRNHGGITNIPFGNERAKTVGMVADFWLEKVRNTNTGQIFSQLQYSQSIFILFHRKFVKDQSVEQKHNLIFWPHVTVNTLVKQ
ncbi:MAG: heme-binding protein [Chloroflexota bacterium]